MNDGEKIGIINGTSNMVGVMIRELSEAMMKVYESDETNPTNLGVSIDEYIKMNDLMISNSENSGNGFLQGKKMNEILGKRK